MSIQKEYTDGKDHIHVLSYGAGTQSTALLLMALKGEINGVIPDYIIFSDTGWEPKEIYEWLEKVNNHIKKHYGKEIIITNNGSIKEDIENSIREGTRLASLPFFTKDEEGKIGIVMRQCTGEYKITPVRKKVRELLGYKPRQRVKEMVHIWKGISTDEIQRVKPSREIWQTAEHPLIDVVNMDRSNCIAYVEREGLGTPPKSSCIGCPFHDNATWLHMKRNNPDAWAEAVAVDHAIRNLSQFNGEVFLHKSGKPLDEVDLNENQLEFDLWGNECEGVCGT